ncbi:helix-turn-helix domain-containing protein [Lactiplantibacillus modestisalitolerans]|uniref:Helix-turn-helix domain-containing protein n=1 Tax=Lactiplantibacillus modestisalitolerans TaxID=1457219 RepID=A0ABV5WSL1_9LACO|nr:helix-turn-helix transcriptional regulator [Lactiplantibacillus modestisalitolerans]
MQINKQATGQRIHQLRQTAHLSMAELASAVGVAGKSTINDWEKGRTLPRAERLQRLANVLATTPDFLLHGSLSEYARAILKTNGLNNSEFNVLLWEYIDLTTTNPNILSGDAFNPTTNHRSTTEIRDRVIDPVIDRALDELLPKLLQHLTTAPYPDSDEIINQANELFRNRIQVIRRTFTGKYNRIIRLIDNVDLYEKLGTDADLKDYLNQATPTTSGYDIDRAYQQKMNALLTIFHQQLNQLNAEYQAALHAPFQETLKAGHANI